MRNNPDDISNQFINFIKKELKKLELIEEQKLLTFNQNKEKHLKII